MGDHRAPRRVGALTVPEPLCRADAIAEGAARGFALGSGFARRLVLVLRKNGILRAYVDSCPHAGTPLEMAADDFFDRDGRYLLCRTHGALFRPEDGVCVAGPCIGARLKPVPIDIADGAIRLAGDGA
jgi:nitrite reductase/ring-hydroxylating ferredoxin subunit